MNIKENREKWISYLRENADRTHAIQDYVAIVPEGFGDEGDICFCATGAALSLLDGITAERHDTFGAANLIFSAKFEDEYNYYPDMNQAIICEYYGMYPDDVDTVQSLNDDFVDWNVIADKLGTMFQTFDQAKLAGRIIL